MNNDELTTTFGENVLSMKYIFNTQKKLSKQNKWIKYEIKLNTACVMLKLRTFAACRGWSPSAGYSFCLCAMIFVYIFFLILFWLNLKKKRTKLWKPFVWFRKFTTNHCWPLKLQDTISITVYKSLLPTKIF